MQRMDGGGGDTTGSLCNSTTNEDKNNDGFVPLVAVNTAIATNVTATVAKETTSSTASTTSIDNKIGTNQQRIIVCHGCKIQFPSKTALFRHIDETEGECLVGEDYNNFVLYHQQSQTQINNGDTTTTINKKYNDRKKREKCLILYGYILNGGNYINDQDNPKDSIIETMECVSSTTTDATATTTTTLPSSPSNEGGSRKIFRNGDDVAELILDVMEYVCCNYNTISNTIITNSGTNTKNSNSRTSSSNNSNSTEETMEQQYQFLDPIRIQQQQQFIHKVNRSYGYVSHATSIVAQEDWTSGAITEVLTVRLPPLVKKKKNNQQQKTHLRPGLIDDPTTIITNTNTNTNSTCTSTSTNKASTSTIDGSIVENSMEHSLDDGMNVQNEIEKENIECQAENIDNNTDSKTSNSEIDDVVEEWIQKVNYVLQTYLHQITTNTTIAMNNTNSNNNTNTIPSSLSTLSPSSSSTKSYSCGLVDVIVYGRQAVHGTRNSRFNAEMDFTNRRVEYIIPADFLYGGGSTTTCTQTTCTTHNEHLHHHHLQQQQCSKSRLDFFHSFPSFQEGRYHKDNETIVQQQHNPRGRSNSMESRDNLPSNNKNNSSTNINNNTMRASTDDNGDDQRLGSSTVRSTTTSASTRSTDPSTTTAQGSNILTYYQIQEARFPRPDNETLTAMKEWKRLMQYMSTNSLGGNSTGGGGDRDDRGGSGPSSSLAATTETNGPKETSTAANLTKTDPGDVASTITTPTADNTMTEDILVVGDGHENKIQNQNCKNNRDRNDDENKIDDEEEKTKETDGSDYYKKQSKRLKNSLNDDEHNSNNDASNKHVEPIRDEPIHGKCNSHRNSNQKDDDVPGGKRSRRKRQEDDTVMNEKVRTKNNNNNINNNNNNNNNNRKVRYEKAMKKKNRKGKGKGTNNAINNNSSQSNTITDQQQSQQQYAWKRKRYHNFTPTVMAHECLAYRRLDRFYHRATIRVENTTNSYSTTESIATAIQTVGNKIEETTDQSFSTSIQSENRPFLVLSLSGDMFLTGQVCRLVGLFVAIARGYISTDIIDCVFDEKYPHLIPTPPMPVFGMYAAEVFYMTMEGKLKSIVTPRLTDRYDAGWNKPELVGRVLEFQNKMRQHVAQTWLSTNICDASISTNSSSTSTSSGDVGRLPIEEHWTNTILIPWAERARKQLQDYKEWKRRNAISGKDSNDLDSIADQNQVDDRIMVQGNSIQETEQAIGKDTVSTISRVRIDSSVPPVYEKVLFYLRQADSSGMWPSTTPKRQLVMVSNKIQTEVPCSERPQMDTTHDINDDERVVGVTNDPSSKSSTRNYHQPSLAEASIKARTNQHSERESPYVYAEGQGGASGSFSVGAMPGIKCIQPKANTMFPELMKAAFELERALCPNREPSSTIAINRNAQFRPHTDSGAGAGQSTSLIVGLGSYEGGELVVEGDVCNIRYNPIEFNGWKQRHWTMPFVGERYSLVWFTPKGCEGVHGIDLCK